MITFIHQLIGLIHGCRHVLILGIRLGFLGNLLKKATYLTLRLSPHESVRWTAIDKGHYSRNGLNTHLAGDFRILFHVHLAQRHAFGFAGDLLDDWTKLVARTVLDDAVAAAKSENKALFVHFTADW